MTFQKSVGALIAVLLLPIMWSFFGLAGLAVLGLATYGIFAGPQRSLASAAGVTNFMFRVLVVAGKFTLIVFAVAFVVEILIAIS